MRREWLVLVLMAACGPDADGDGVVGDEDCDEARGDVYSGAPEFCDGVDNDCNGITDEPTAEDTTVFYIDRDGDGFGTKLYDRDGDGTPEASGVLRTCVIPLGYSTTEDDCDDDDVGVFPGQGC